MMKKLILAAAGLALSAPVLADQGHRNNRGHGYGHDRHVVVHKHHYVQHRPARVYHAPVYHYRPAPRPVYVVRHAPPPPAVVYHQSHSNAGAALLVGAILGGAIVHSVVTGGY
jgi:hypothetical protein